MSETPTQAVPTPTPARPQQQHAEGSLQTDRAAQVERAQQAERDRQGERPQQSEHSQAERAQHERAHAERAQTERTQNERTQSERAQAERAQQSDRDVQSDRAQQADRHADRERAQEQHVPSQHTQSDRTPAQQTAAHRAQDTTAGSRPSSKLEDEWQAVQYDFVDDPKAAVRKADQLVTRAIEELTNRHRSLTKQLEGNGDPQTEDLRLALHRYRELFKSLVAVK